MWGRINILLATFYWCLSSFNDYAYCCCNSIPHSIFFPLTFFSGYGIKKAVHIATVLEEVMLQQLAGSWPVELLPSEAHADDILKPSDNFLSSWSRPVVCNPTFSVDSSSSLLYLFIIPNMPCRVQVTHKPYASYSAVTLTSHISDIVVQYLRTSGAGQSNCFDNGAVVASGLIGP